MSKANRRSVSRSRRQQRDLRVESASLTPMPQLVGPGVPGGNLSLDLSSPVSVVEDLFFQKGVAAESSPENPDLWSPALPEKEADRGLRMVAVAGTIGALVLAGVGIWKARSVVAAPAVEAARVVAAAAAKVDEVPAVPPPAPMPVAATAVPVPAPVAPVVAAAPVAAAPAPTFALMVPKPEAPPVTQVAAASRPARPVFADDDPEKSCKSAYSRHNFRETVDVCSLAIESRPGSANLAVMLAHAETERGHPARALAWAKKAITIDPATAEAYVFMGSAEQEFGHAQQARTAYAKYLQLAPRGRHAADLRAVMDSL